MLPVGPECQAFPGQRHLPPNAQSLAVGEAAWHLREHYKVRQLILGLDPLDYTEGIPERFRWTGAPAASMPGRGVQEYLPRKFAFLAKIPSELEWAFRQMRAEGPMTT